MFSITKLPDYKITNSSLFLHNWIVAIADEAGAHTLGFLQVGVGPDLNVIELVAGRTVSGEGRILLLFQSPDQRFGVFLPANGGDLHVVTAARGRRGGGVCGGLWRGFRSGGRRLRLRIPGRERGVGILLAQGLVQT